MAEFSVFLGDPQGFEALSWHNSAISCEAYSEIQLWDVPRERLATADGTHIGRGFESRQKPLKFFEGFEIASIYVLRLVARTAGRQGGN